MKTKALKLSVLVCCFVALAMNSYSQSSVVYQLRDSSPPHTFYAYIAVWDDVANTFLGSTQGPAQQYAGQYNHVNTTQTLPFPSLTPRYNIIIQVDELDAFNNVIGTQYRQSGDLTSAQYDAGNIPLSGITF